MRRLATWWRGCQSGFGIRAVRPRARRRAALRLETLEQRLNLAAVLVVETVDAYWLIEDPEFSSLTPAASSDALHGDSGHDEAAMGLPSDVALAAASGDSLNSAESNLAWSLLNELWDTEPDFFYEDVLAMTFYSDSTMDSVLASGLFDDSSDLGSSFENDFVANDFFDDTDLSGSAGSDFLDFGSEPSSDFADSSFATDEALPVEAEALMAEESDVLDLAKAEVASWSQRLDAQSFALPGASRSVADETSMAAVVPTKFVIANDPKFDPAARASDEPAVREVPPASASAAARSIQESAVTPTETRSIDSFFSRFPTFFGMRVSRSERVPLARGESESADGSSDPVEADATWSYSQWASLVGVAGLTAASLWTPNAPDMAAAPFRTKSNGKRPVAC